MSLLGLGSVNITSIKTNHGNQESIDLVDLEKNLAIIWFAIYFNFKCWYGEYRRL